MVKIYHAAANNFLLECVSQILLMQRFIDKVRIRFNPRGSQNIKFNYVI